jgi:hypothetical protein
MSDFPPKDPYSNQDYSPANPYPGDFGTGNGKITAPAIAMMVLGVLGVIASIAGLLMLIGGVAKPEIDDPEMPEMLKGLVEVLSGPVGMAIQAVMIFVNAIIFLGGLMMSRLKAWVLCLIAAILLTLNLGSCLCFAGIPVGIWSIVVLMMNDVRQKFAANV